MPLPIPDPLALQAAALAAVLALASVVATRALGATRTTRLAAIALALLVAAWSYALERRRESDVSLDDAPLATAHDGYVGSGACLACHPSEYASWSASYHRRMTQAATPQAVVAPIDGTVLEGHGRRYELSRSGDSFWVDMQDPDDADPSAPRVRRRIVMTTGSHHEQDFWYEAGPGRAVAHFPFVWRIAEKRWLPNGATFLAPPSDPRAVPHEERGGWNRNCIQCHATGAVPAIGAADTRTEVAELGIACEACHGPGQRHVEANRDPLRRYRLHEAALAGDDEGCRDDTIVNPRRLPHDRRSEVCGQCHLVSTVLGPRTDPEWNERGFDYRPGDVLSDSRVVLHPGSAPDDPQLLRASGGNPRFLRDRFWPDGMIRVSGREFQGLSESACYVSGELSCTTCHRMHGDLADQRPPAEWADDQLSPSAIDGSVCRSCHPDEYRRIDLHTHHKPDSSGSGCYGCHMPHTTYGLLKGIRSHQVQSPSATETARTGRPNACNLCHLDRTLAWTAEWLDRWYGIAAPELSDEDRRTAASVRWILEGDAGLRAIIAWQMGRDESRAASGAGGDAAWTEPFVAHLLDDPYDAVRLVAEGTWRRFPRNAGADYDAMAPAATRAARSATDTAATAARDVRALADPSTVLLDAAGRLDRARFETLSSRRDDRAVELRE